MRVEMFPQNEIRRGSPVKIGNVYQNPHGRPFYKVVIGIVDGKWNGVVMMHIDAKGNVVGSSNQPLNYVKDHHDLMGCIREFPKMKVDFIRQ